MRASTAVSSSQHKPGLKAVFLWLCFVAAEVEWDLIEWGVATSADALFDQDDVVPPGILKIILAMVSEKWAVFDDNNSFRNQTSLLYPEKTYFYPSLASEKFFSRAVGLARYSNNVVADITLQIETNEDPHQCLQIGFIEYLFCERENRVVQKYDRRFEHTTQVLLRPNTTGILCIHLRGNGRTMRYDVKGEIAQASKSYHFFNAQDTKSEFSFVAKARILCSGIIITLVSAQSTDI